MERARIALRDVGLEGTVWIISPTNCPAGSGSGGHRPGADQLPGHRDGRRTTGNLDTSPV